MINKVFNQEGSFVWNYTCNNENAHLSKCKVCGMGAIAAAIISTTWSLMKYETKLGA